MKTKIFSSLIAVLLLNLCLSKTFAQDEKVYSHVSLKNPPTYPGGIQDFYSWLGNTLKYPTLAAQSNVQGTVYLSFNIEKDGTLDDIKVGGKKLGYGLDEEAVRAIKLSKKWNPGIYNEKPVRVKYNLPVKFTIPNKRKKAAAPVPSDHDKTVYNHVTIETPPTYPGGIEQFYKMIGANMKYPKAAMDAKIQGSVYVSFIIEKDGSLTDAKIDGKRLGGGTDEEAISVLQLSKKWNPGLQNGKPVRTKYNVPIKFTMKK